MSELAFFEDRFLPIDQVRIPVNDRGYLFADGIYEVVATRRGRPFLFREHFRRFERSAAAIGLRLPFSFSRLESLVAEGIKRAGFTETMVYIQVTRGVEKRRHNYSPTIEPTWFMTFRKQPKPTPEQLGRGVGIITVPEIRWRRCDIKSIALLPNIMMKQQAVEQGCQEALFVAADGVIHECTTANIFLVREQALVTPPADHRILAGITRGFIIDQARARGIEVRERECRIEELLEADEAFITSSTIDLLPVVRVDDHIIGRGRPGPVSRTVAACFTEAIPQS